MSMGTMNKPSESHTDTCKVCGSSPRHISRTLAVCSTCLGSSSEQAHPHVEVAHMDSRRRFGLPAQPPRSPDGITCVLCSNQCRLSDGERGFCGLRLARGGRLVHLAGTPNRGLLHWYRDPLPTNCVADWVCEGHRQVGFHNLAVFYTSCTANCLFCQNWHFRETDLAAAKPLSALELASVANSRTFCVCFFGGDPTSQLPHALAAAKHLARQGVRVCWETNGMMHPKLARAALRIALRTGGCIKFDLKAFDDQLHRALTGISNQRTLDNFTQAARRSREQPESTQVVASTLLVPGYVDHTQVRKIARFIAALDPGIPYALLAFAPHFYMRDLPRTSAQHAAQARQAALDEGLVHVRIGNQHLLRTENY